MDSRRRWLWLLLLPLLAAGIARLRFDTEMLNLLPREIPAVHGLLLYQRHFSGSDELLISINAGDADVAAETARGLCEALRARSDLVARAFWQPPMQEHPEQLGELFATLWLNGSPQQFSDFATSLSAANIARKAAASRDAIAASLSPGEIARLGYDPLGLTRLPGMDETMNGFSGDDPFFAPGDGTLRVLLVKPARAAKSYRETAAWLGEVRVLVEGFRVGQKINSSVTFGYTGAPAFVTEIATEMERDMTSSAIGTIVLIALIFWLVHRRLLPLLWLLVLLALITAGTLAFGGFVFGTLNVISLGFASILLGLTVDYALVLYQEARTDAAPDATRIRREQSGGILWSAVTTACAFVLLNFSGLPGLAQLGTLVAFGILSGAFVMLWLFLPVVLAKPVASAQKLVSRQTNRSASARGIWMLTGVIIAVSVLSLVRGFPGLDHSPEALASVNSHARAVLKEIEARRSSVNESLWLIVTATNETALAEKTEALAALLDKEKENVRPWLGDVLLPAGLLPWPERQRANLPLAIELSSRADEIKAQLRAAGFTDDAFSLANGVLETWRRAAEQQSFTPTNPAVTWLVDQGYAHTDGQHIALGVVQPVTNALATFALASAHLGDDLKRMDVSLTGWPVLGESLLQHATQRLPWLAAVMMMFVAGCLWIAFGNLRETMLSLGALVLGGLLMLALMSVCGWSWNLVNLMAAPLLLGAGVDYTIHVQLALRRHAGDVRAMWRSTGIALLLCAGTTVIGFGSLAWAGSAGLASLGKLCAAGVACVWCVSLLLLPGWWCALVPLRGGARKPSSLYAAWAWRLGLFWARVLPVSVSHPIARMGGSIYAMLARHRRAVVVENLLPVVGEDKAKAERAAKESFGEFAVKLVDLWRHEAGTPTEQWRGEWRGWEHFERARARGRGVLLVTPHLGNWELGGAFVAARGVALTVLTAPEPEVRLMEMRRRSRARFGVETLVVGDDPFGAVEVVKRLNDGGVVALLLDRPATATAVTVELCGRPFMASNAAAELARASGCAILPVYIVRSGDGYLTEILPEVGYDRASIGDRDARIGLTQRILRALEPVIRQHPAQWFHFVPVWAGAVEHRAVKDRNQ